jgi:Protein of unknown function (DUF2637)
MSLPQLRRVRWAVRLTLLLGVAASVAANILHAEPNPISQVIAAWPPLALLLTIELISRVPVHRRSLAVVRLGATTGIAGIAAWVSYWHMAGVAARYGETGGSPYLLPLSVDGLVIVASVSLVELAGRIRLAEAGSAGTATPAADPVRAPAKAMPRPAVDPVPAPAKAMPRPAVDPVPAPAETVPAPDPVPVAGSPTAVSRPDGVTVVARPAEARPTRPQPRRTSPTRDEKPRIANATTAAPAKRTPVKSRTRRPVTETAALAARIEAAEPDLSHDDIAARLGISTQHLRRIRREVAVAA